ncbi:MAG: hypothetical protein KIT63_02525 [Rhodoferax sp.]|nr:hypothetical protein [Rhodoferax sp.]
MKLPKVLRLVVTTVGLVGASLALAASPFDGAWKGVGAATAACTDKAEVTFTIKNGEFVQFALVGPMGVAEGANGAIREDGTSQIEYGSRKPRLKGALTLKGDSFEGKLDTRCGMREFSGSRG